MADTKTISLQGAIEHDFDQTNGTIAPNQEVKAWISQSEEQLHSLFYQHHPIIELLQGRSSIMDELLCALWNKLTWPTFPSVTLIAVGGYGRGELFPHSDIDLLILREPGDIASLSDPLEKFVSSLWNLGLKVGHSVRTLNECIEQAEADVVTLTNLIESRVLAGAERLFHAFHQQLTSAKVWPSLEFFHAKQLEQKERHHKNFDSEYYLEPNVKNAPGSLRDIHMIKWVAKRELGDDSFQNLVNLGLMNQEERHQLRQGRAFLSKTRYALHLLTQRDENRLLFDYQKSIAKMLNYEGEKANLAVEGFMQDYYRHAMEISELNDILLQQMKEHFYQDLEKHDAEHINDHFQLRNGFLEVKDPYVFSRQPSTLLSMFVVMGQNARVRGVRASTIRLMRKHRHLVDEHFRNDAQNVELFIQIIRSPYRLYTQLNRMKRYGILGRYIPAFGDIIGKMQYDLFHIYTVDAHTLLVVQNMRKLRHEASKEAFPIAANVIHFLPKLELLYLAGLFHDMAKGRDGDHSKLGAVDAENFCLRHNLSIWDAHLVSWLVENHLAMSITAQKEDISEPEVIQNFAAIVGDQIHLDYLFVLTICDICATNPKLWNSWRASLLRQLYTETKHALQQGAKNITDRHERLLNTYSEAAHILQDTEFEKKDMQAFWDSLGEEYFMRNTPKDIAWHTRVILTNPEKDTLVDISDTDTRDLTTGKQIFIYTKDQQNLFAATVTILDQLGLSIQDARIITSKNGYSLDTYVIMDNTIEGGQINNPDRIQEILNTLNTTLSQPEDFQSIVKKRLPRKLKYFEVPTEVNISNDLFNLKTVVEIKALDHPGLLATIGYIFAGFGIMIENAKIATLGECAEDVFFVVDEHHNPLSDAKVCKALRKTLKEKIDQRD